MDAAALCGECHAPSPETKRQRWTIAKAALLFASVALLPLFLLSSNLRASLLPIAANAADPGPTPPRDKLIGGLLPPAMDENACWSRYEASLYRRPSPFPVSPPLAGKLRAYEAYHHRCGPGTHNYATALQQLNSGGAATAADAAAGGECKYLVWSPMGGLGNQMLSLASAFLYALLSNRALLVRFPDELQDLFCEPFPNSSWALPRDFPFHDKLDTFRDTSPESYEKMLKENRIPAAGEAAPPLVYFHLVGWAGPMPLRSFCDEDHLVLSQFKWMILKSDCFFAAGLFLMPSYADELHRLFPEKEAVFHHLGRYLFHPGNEVWGMVTRYYAGYLASADERIGIQVRLFPFVPINDTYDGMAEGIKECIRQPGLLPPPSPVDFHNATSPPGTAAKHSKAVLVTSLKSKYYEKLRATYYEKATASGEVVAVHQPTHEEEQAGSAMHNQRALAEIYLLSLCEKLVTSGWSTFGYIAHSLAGVRPWLMIKGECVRSESPEPCMHALPWRAYCSKTDASGNAVDPMAYPPFVRHCEDAGGGIKLFPN